MQARMVAWVISAWALTACWSHEPPPPAAPAAPVIARPAPAPVVERDDPGSAKSAIARMATFRDAMCKCTAKACADQVVEEMTQWGQQMAREGGARRQPVTDDDTREMAEVTEVLTRCMVKAMVANAPQGSAPPIASDPDHVQNVAPTALDANRIAGTKTIVPDDADKRSIARAGKTKLVASFKLCIDVDGNIAEIARLKSSGFPGYDAKLDREMRHWRYRPFLVNGAPAPVCTAVTFIYAQEPPPPPPAR